jgi:hypothetical protein
MKTLSKIISELVKYCIESLYSFSLDSNQILDQRKSNHLCTIHGFRTII